MGFEERMRITEEQRKAADQARIHEFFRAKRENHLLRLRLEEIGEAIGQLVRTSEENGRKVGL